MGALLGPQHQSERRAVEEEGVEAVSEKEKSETKRLKVWC